MRQRARTLYATTELGMLMAKKKERRQRALPVTYTIFPNPRPRNKKEITAAWHELVDYIRDAPTYIDKQHCPLISLARYGTAKTAKGCVRFAANVKRVYGIELDYDGEQLAIARAAKLLQAANLRAVLYSSPSYTADAPRWRVLLPLSAPVKPAKRAYYAGIANRVLGGVISRESFTLSQSYYIGRVRGAPYKVLETDGVPLDELDDVEPQYFTDHAHSGETPHDSTPDSELRKTFKRGEDRYQAMLKLSARWAARGMAADDIEQALLDMLGDNYRNADGVDLRKRAASLAASAARKFGETRRIIHDEEDEEEDAELVAAEKEAARDTPKKARGDSKSKKPRPDADAPPVVRKLNRRLAFISINGSASILCERDDPDYPGTKTFTLSAERDMQLEYANKCVNITVGDKVKSVSKFEIWKRDPHRREVRRLVLSPGAPSGHSPDTGDFNIWQGWGVTPAAGDWSLMQEHIEKILARGNKAHAEFIINWSAHCVQHPDRIPESSIAFLGSEGCGKGIFCRAMVHIHGRHGAQLVSPDELLGRWNGRLRDKLLIFADEAFFAGDPKGNGKLKGMLTEPFVSVEEKFKDIYEIRNYRKLLIASNESWVVPAGPSARRYAVFRVSNARVGDSAYFSALQAQMDNGGYAAMLHDLMHRDIANFNPRDIPATPELFEQKKIGFDAITQWWFEKLQDVDGSWASEDGRAGEAMSRDAVCEAVMPYVMGTYDKRALRIRIGLSLRSMCPEVQFDRVRSKGDRVRKYIFPSLSRCRAAFERYVKQEINWSMGTARKTPRNPQE